MNFRDIKRTPHPVIYRLVDDGITFGATVVKLLLVRPTGPMVSMYAKQEDRYDGYLFVVDGTRYMALNHPNMFNDCLAFDISSKDERREARDVEVDPLRELVRCCGVAILYVKEEGYLSRTVGVCRTEDIDAVQGILACNGYEAHNVAPFDLSGIHVTLEE